MKKKNNIWVLIAASFEVSRFESTIEGIRVDDDVTLVPIVCGVGHHHSMYNLEQYYAELPRPSGIILLGSCGVFLEEQVKKIYISRNFSLPPFKHEQYPDLINQGFHFELLPQLENHSLEELITFSTLGISVSSRRFVDTKDKGENMESYSIAFWAAQKNIPFNALLCATNIVGKNGRKEFQKNYATCGNTLHDTFAEYFSAQD